MHNKRKRYCYKSIKMSKYYFCCACLSAMLIAVWDVEAFGVLKSCSRQLSITRLFTASKENDNKFCNDRSLSRRNWIYSTAAVATGTIGLGVVPTLVGLPESANARLESVNNPKLLPSQPGLNVIQTEKFLTTGQAKRLDGMLSSLEKDSGYRVRVLCQAYPNTPGLAIREYWSVGYDEQKDDKYVVLVVDQFGGKGNVLNFNVGEGVKLTLPNVFWTRLQARYGTTFYVRDNGIDLAIINAIEAIVTCLRSEEQYCVNVPDTAPSLRSLGFA
jgi:TPM domain